MGLSDRMAISHTFVADKIRIIEIIVAMLLMFSHVAGPLE